MHWAAIHQIFVQIIAAQYRTLPYLRSLTLSLSFQYVMIASFEIILSSGHMEMVGWFLDQTKMVDPKVRTFN